MQKNADVKKKIAVAAVAVLVLCLLIFQKQEMDRRERGKDEIEKGEIEKNEVSASFVPGIVPKETDSLQRTQNQPQDAEKKKIALTFDDGPHPTFTGELLDGLKERGIHASFFVTGEHAKLHPDIVKRMKEEGHLIGNHTYSHVQLKKESVADFKDELLRTNEVIRQITGAETEFVRPPYGTWDKSLESELNMIPVLWNIDPRDWCNGNADCVAFLVEKEAKEGAIILLHDYYSSSVKAALRIVDDLVKKGYVFVTVDEILFD